MSELKRRRAASLALPSIDLRRHLSGTIRPQGCRPLCVPFTLGAAHQVTRSLVHSDRNELAVEPIWQHCIHAGTAGADGTTLAAAGDALGATGQTLELLWPYDATLGDGTEATPATVGIGDFHTATTTSVPLHHDGVEEPIEESLAQGLPVALVVEVTKEFEDAPAAEIEVPPITAPLGDYHAVLAVGVATNPAVGRRRLLVRNSWGAFWGAAGHAWLPYEYLIAHAVDAARIDPSKLGSR